jgi:hypothetical protein
VEHTTKIYVVLRDGQTSWFHLRGFWTILCPSMLLDCCRWLRYIILSEDRKAICDSDNRQCAVRSLLWVCVQLTVCELQIRNAISLNNSVVTFVPCDWSFLHSLRGQIRVVSHPLLVLWSVSGSTVDWCHYCWYRVLYVASECMNLFSWLKLGSMGCSGHDVL